MPEKTAAQKRAQQKYMEKFVRVEIRMEAEKRATIQSHAEACSESVNGFINRAISETMERDNGTSRPQEAPQAPHGAGTVFFSDTLKTAQEAAQNAGETVPRFIERAVDTQAKRDKTSLALGINPATGGKLEKEA